MDEFRKQRRRLVGSSVVAIVLIVVLMVTLVVTLMGYVERSVHRERETYLVAQTQTTVGLIDKTISQYSDFADVCASVISSRITGGETVDEYMAEVQTELFLEGARLILVDESCNWYGENGTTGRITDVSSYESSTPRNAVYITKGVDVEEESIVYRVRLDHPVSLYTDNGLVRISYCAVICYMGILHEQVKVAFPYECNRFIADETGLMIYRELDLGLLMDGSNLFSKCERVNFLYGGDGSQMLEDLKQGSAAVGEFEINGTDYFICMAPLGINDWYLAYVLESDSLSAGTYFEPMFRYIGVICALFGLAIILAFMVLLYSQNSKKQLEVQRQANGYLQQASASKSTFLANMSHDIRTPINGIMGMTLLAQKEDNPPKTVDCLQRIDGASRHLLALVNDVLDMSSIESGKLEIIPKPVFIHTVPETCVSIIQGQLEGRQLVLVSHFEKLTHPALMADELHLRQVLINILSNAVKYTPDGGSITFTMKELTSTAQTTILRFEVADTGIGMKPEFLDKIWDSFSQEDAGARSNFKGTGLGMTITKQLVELMGGTISVQSVYEKGSTFTVDLPFAVTDLEEPEQTAENSTADIRGIKILLADDNDLNRMIAQELLEDEGAVVTTANDGKQALSLFETSQPGDFDLILMDIMMPEMDGLEASRCIRALERPDAGTIPIIAMTANAFEWDIQASHEAGMNAHLSKPVDLPVLLQTLSNYYHRKEG